MSNYRGGILQTPEFLINKEGRAGFEIGRHVLIAVLYQGGAVFGMRHNPRRNNAMQWLHPLTPTIVLAGWGEYSHHQVISQFLEQSAQGLAEYVGEPYVTLPYLSKILCPLMREQFEQALPYSLDILLVDVVGAEIRFVDFHGNLTILKGFGVLGGYPYYNEEKIAEIVKKIDATSPGAHDPSLMEGAAEFPRKRVIEYLEHGFKGKDQLATKSEALKLVSETVIGLDLPSKKELFSIIAYDADAKAFQCSIIERKKASGKKQVRAKKKLSK